MEEWESTLNARSDLQKYGDNAIGLFALALRFTLEDLDSVAAQAITDGSDDKKCDLLFVDSDEGAAVVAQCYVATSAKAAAPSNKAADLNTAVGWLLQTTPEQLPARLRPAATELRDAIESGAVSDLHIWYVHNLPESKNVENELDIVRATAISALKHAFPGKDVNVLLAHDG